MAKTLAEKLLIREGSRIAVIEAPEGYDTLLGELPAVSRGQPSSMAPSTGSSIL